MSSPGGTLRLLRLSLFPTAAADVAAGTVLAAGVWPGGAAPWLAIAGSLSVYHGGMALNDWADRKHDARTRPERPLPAGEVAPTTALLLGSGLLLAGPLLGLAAAPGTGALLGAAAVLAALYDLRGRGPLTGPALLALCRAANLGAGLALGAAVAGTLPSGLLVVPFCYGTYVFLVSRLGRLEDASPDPEALVGNAPPRLLRLAAVALVLVPLVALGTSLRSREPELVSALAALILAAAGAAGLLTLGTGGGAWTQARVRTAMGAALRRLLVFSASVALLAGPPDGFVVAALALAGYPVSHLLRRWIPPS